jgi:hypothetical protein
LLITRNSIVKELFYLEFIQFYISSLLIDSKVIFEGNNKKSFKNYLHHPRNPSFLHRQSLLLHRPRAVSQKDHQHNRQLLVRHQRLRWFIFFLLFLAINFTVPLSIGNI